jgi:glycine/D-amino acid oxidase-like deaminating enzyme
VGPVGSQPIRSIGASPRRPEVRLRIVQADVIVVGLGTMGAAVTHRLAARGLHVAAYDRFDPPHDRGAHSGGSRIIRMAYMEGVDYVPLVRRSYELWRELEAEASQRLLTITGGLMLGQPDSVAVAGATASARAHGLKHELLDADEVRRRFPMFTPSDGEIALYEEAAGLVRPGRAIATYLRLARAGGAMLHTRVRVEGWTADSGGVAVATDDGTAHAERLILCPGAWAPGLTRVPVPLRVQRRVQHFWRPSDPDGFGPEVFPIWIAGRKALPLHADTGRALRARTTPRPPECRCRMWILGPRVQVRPRRRRDPGGPRHHWHHLPRHRSLRPQPIPSCRVTGSASPEAAAPRLAGRSLITL